MDARIFGLNMPGVPRPGREGGPHVKGKRGDRYLYLSWAQSTPKARPRCFDDAKLVFDAIGNELLQTRRNDPVTC